MGHVETGTFNHSLKQEVTIKVPNFICYNFDYIYHV